MSNNLELKKAAVSEITDKFKRATSAVLLDYRGLTVLEVTELRRQCREAGVEYKVYKNRLMLRAANEAGISGLEQYLEGPTAIAFSYSDPVLPAKILSDSIKKLKKTELKAGLIGTSVIDAKGVQALSDLPPKEVLVAKLLGTLNAPITGFVGVLSGVPRAFVCALDAIAKQKEETN